MNISFQKLILPDDKTILMEWLSSQVWPFHGDSVLTPEQIDRMLTEGVFDGSNHQTFWIISDNQERIGYVRLFDLDDIGDGAPMFDIRVKSEIRGKGIGHQAVQWLLKYMFEHWPELHRIEATTREDNFAMRRVLQKCNFAEEGRLRKSWKTSEGLYYDTIVCGILREDWGG